MTSSYEARIVSAMLRWVDAKSAGDESEMGAALLDAMTAATRLRTERHHEDDSEELGTTRHKDTEREIAAVKP